MNSDNLKFISNNVKGIQKSEKRIKIFEYLKNVMRCAIWGQSLFGICMDVQTLANAC